MTSQRAYHYFLSKRKIDTRQPIMPHDFEFFISILLLFHLLHLLILIIYGYFKHKIKIYNK